MHALVEALYLAPALAGAALARCGRSAEGGALTQMRRGPPLRCSPSGVPRCA